MKMTVKHLHNYRCIIQIVVLLLLYIISGIKAQQRIIGGVNAEISEYPWVCSLKFKQIHACAVQLAGEDIAITAAQCVNERGIDELAVQCFTTDVSGKPDGQYIPVKKFYVHERFDKNTFRHDIAIIHLLQKLTPPTNSIVSVLDKKANANDMKDCKIYGWGLGDDFNDQKAHYFKRLDVNIIQYEECRGQYPVDGAILESNLCSKPSGNTGFCKGDQGTPLICTNSQTGVLDVYGLASFYSSCNSSTPQVFTKLAFYREWLLQNLGQ